MKTKIEISGNLFEDKDDFKMVIHVYDMMTAIHEAREKIASRLKYGRDVSNNEEKTLHELIDTLWIEGLGL